MLVDWIVGLILMIMLRFKSMDPSVPCFLLSLLSSVLKEALSTSPLAALWSCWVKFQLLRQGWELLTTFLPAPTIYTSLRATHIVISSEAGERPEVEKWWLDWDTLHRKDAKILLEQLVSACIEAISFSSVCAVPLVVFPLSLCFSGDIRSTPNGCLMSNPNAI